MWNCFFGIIWLFDGIAVNLVLDYVAFVRLHEFYWSALSKQSCFYEHENDMHILWKETEPLKRILPDGTKAWRDGGDEIFSVYCKEYVSRAMTVTFSKAAMLRYIDSG